MPPKKAAAKGKAKGKGKDGKKGKPEDAAALGAEQARNEAEELKLQLKVAEDEQKDFQRENRLLANNLRQKTARYAVTETDKDDILAFRQAEIGRKEARIAELEAKLAEARGEAEGCKRIIGQMKNHHRGLMNDFEGASQELQSTQSELTLKRAEALRLQDRAGEAERLALEVRGLQAELRSSCLRVKELTLASAGKTEIRVLHGDAWLISVSMAQLGGDERPCLRDGNVLCCCEHGKQLWMYGGQGTDAYELNMLSLDTLRWEGTQGTKAPHLAHQPGAVAITHSKIFTFGGRRGPHLSDEVQILQTANAEWQVRESVDSARPCARYGPALAYHSGKVFMFGGCGADGRLLQDTWVYHLTKNQWSHLAAPKGSPHTPSGRLGATLCADQDDVRLWLFGGNAGGGSLADLYCLDTHTSTWGKVQALGRPVMGRERHTACMVQHYMVVCGGVVRAGQDADYTLLGDVQAFDTTTHFWDCVDEGTWADDKRLVRKPAAILSASFQNRIHILKPAWPSEELDELQTIEITSPQGIAAHKAAHKDERVIVETLAIQPSAVCTPSSIEISWVPPTRNVDRIVGYKVMLATTLGIVKQVYHGHALSYKVEGLRPNLEFVFCVKAMYDDGSFLWSEPQPFRTKC